MGKKIRIICVCFMLTLICKSQTVKKKLQSANSIYFHHNLYVYGYEQKNNLLLFKCFSYSENLKLQDSTEYNIGKHTASDFLEITADTLHGCINFYFQLANQKNKVTLLRLNDTLEKICFAENYDANRINPLTSFGDETYIFKDYMYTIRTSSDTSGNQFYLSKYQVQSITKPFEYTFKWQFPFERKYIHRATVLYADSNYIMVYTNIYDGSKKGQWVLRINANTGELIKGTKLNAKGDSRCFLISNLMVDKKTKNSILIGSIYDANMIDFKNKIADFTNLYKRHTLFLISLDSLGEISTKTEKLFPLPINTKTQTHLQSFHVKIREFKKLPGNNFEAWADIYEMSKPNTLCYYSSWHIDITLDHINYTINPSLFFVPTTAIPSFISFAKGDTYGKFSLNDIGDYDGFKYKLPYNPVVIKTGMDELKKSFYVLKKTDILNATKTYNYVFVGKKGLEKKVILKSEQGQKANVYFTKNTTYISFMTNIANSEFELKIDNL